MKNKKVIWLILNIKLIISKKIQKLLKLKQKIKVKIDSESLKIKITLAKKNKIKIVGNAHCAVKLSVYI